MDAELDELGVDARRARHAERAVPDLGAVHAPVERLVLEDAEVPQPVPLRPGLRVLPVAAPAAARQRPTSRLAREYWRRRDARCG